MNLKREQISRVADPPELFPQSSESLTVHDNFPEFDKFFAVSSQPPLDSITVDGNANVIRPRSSQAHNTVQPVSVSTQAVSISSASAPSQTPSDITFAEFDSFFNVNVTQNVAISSVSEPSQPLLFSPVVQPVALSSVSAPSQPHATAINTTPCVSQVVIFSEFDKLFTDLGVDSARVQLPLPAQLIATNARSTPGIVTNSFSARRKRFLSVPHHVARNRHTLNIALPTDEPIESFIAKRRRIDTIHVMTRCHPTDAPT